MKNISYLRRRIFLQIRYAIQLRPHFCRMQKGLSELIPRSTTRRSFERILAEREREGGGAGRYFRGNLDRDKAESTQLPEEHNTREIFAKKLRAWE